MEYPKSTGYCPPSAGNVYTAASQTWMDSLADTFSCRGICGYERSRPLSEAAAQACHAAYCCVDTAVLVTMMMKIKNQVRNYY